MNSTAAIYARLSGDAYLTGLLATYTPPGGRQSFAIFNDQSPDGYVFGADNPKPVIVISAASVTDNASTLSETAWAVQQDVRLYAFRGMSTADLDTAARRVRDLFHMQPERLVVAGGFATISTATGPVEAPTTDTSVSGRRVTLRLELQEN